MKMFLTVHFVLCNLVYCVHAYYVIANVLDDGVGYVCICQILRMREITVFSIHTKPYTVQHISPAIPRIN